MRKEERKKEEEREITSDRNLVYIIVLARVARCINYARQVLRITEVFLVKRTPC